MFIRDETYNITFIYQMSPIITFIYRMSITTISVKRMSQNNHIHILDVINNHIHIPDIINMYSYIIHTPGDISITQSCTINVYHSPPLPDEWIPTHVKMYTIRLRFPTN